MGNYIMGIISYDRGHKIEYINKRWFYRDTGEPLEFEKPRPCKRCGKMPTSEGYDACIGYVEGAESVCCGHGKSAPILMRRNN